MASRKDDSIRYMKRALVLAKRGLGLNITTSPNPMVGAVLVRSGKVIGCGYHKKAGGPHAEVAAISDAVKKGNKRLIKGADLFVTLEPCNHTGRTPPCTEAVIEAGIGRVIVGAKDPNPKVSGSGIRRLKRAGVEVTTGVLSQECTALNEAYNKYITTGRPFVTLKLGMSIDGKISEDDGASTGAVKPTVVSSKESLRRVHEMRSKVDCVMVGSGTAVADDPRLTVRGVSGKNPIRAVVDTKLSIKPTARIFKSKGRAIIFTSKKTSKKRVEAIEGTGGEVVALPPLKNNKVSLKRVMTELGRREVVSLMVEGGAKFSAALLKEGLIDKVVFFIAPKVIGDNGLSAIGDIGGKAMNGLTHIKDMKVERVGPDMMVTGYM